MSTALVIGCGGTIGGAWTVAAMRTAPATVTHALAASEEAR
jgi:hypothetical protein